MALKINFGKFIRIRHHLKGIGSLSTSTEATTTNASEPRLNGPVEQLFTAPRVQILLKKLTGVDLKKIFRTRRVPKLTRSSFELVTEEELQEFTSECRNRAVDQLQFPPYMSPRKPLKEVIAEDREIEAHDRSKFVFTDITFGIPDRQRLVVVREPSGVLRRATWDERDRMNRIYFNHEVKAVKMPKLFEPEQLREALNQDKHEFILDLACAQFEPDDPEYLRISTSVYSHTDDRRKFNLLHSTRHYGGFVFHLAVNRRIDNLLITMSDQGRIGEMFDLVELFYLIHPGKIEGSPVEIFRHYVREHSAKRPSLELILQAIQQQTAKEPSAQ